MFGIRYLTLLISTFAVKKRHADLVPDQLTEQDFWTRFFQSHYFHRERAVDRSAENIFGDSAMLEEKG